MRQHRRREERVNGSIGPAGVASSDAVRDLISAVCDSGRTRRRNPLTTKIGTYHSGMEVDPAPKSSPPNGWPLRTGRPTDDL